MLEIIDKTRIKPYKNYYRFINQYYKKTLEVLKIEDTFDLSLILVGPRTIRKINRDYRKIDKETDVISFALLDEMEEYELPELTDGRRKILEKLIPENYHKEVLG